MAYTDLPSEGRVRADYVSMNGGGPEARAAFDQWLSDERDQAARKALDGFAGWCEMVAGWARTPEAKAPYQNAAGFAEGYRDCTYRLIAAWCGTCQMRAEEYDGALGRARLSAWMDSHQGHAVARVKL